MKIAVYMNNFIYKYGGTEGYTANLIEVLQNLYPDSQISIITELHKKRDRVDIDDFLADQNKTYGLNINKKKRKSTLYKNSRNKC